MSPEKEAAIRQRDAGTELIGDPIDPPEGIVFSDSCVMRAYDRRALLAAVDEVREVSAAGYGTAHKAILERDAARAALEVMTIDRNGHRALSAEMEDACDALAKALHRALHELGGRPSEHWDSTMQAGRGCPVCIHEGDTTKELAVVLAAHEAQKEGA